ncbi:MAG: Ig-like domain-containing protein [Candidatus Sulfotelmatobacter sp.]
MGVHQSTGQPAGHPDLAVVNECGNEACHDGVAGVLLHVGEIRTRTTERSSSNPSAYLQPVALSATVSSSSGAPAGTVVFYDGSSTLGTATLANGSATISVSSLSVGSHVITTLYQGSLKFNSSVSSPLTQVVTTANTTTSIGSSANPVLLNKYVTYTATVASQYGAAATGTVTFQDNGATVATVGVTNNQAAFTTKYKTAGVQLMTAIYSGDSNNLGSASSIFQEDVGKPPYASKTTVATSGSPSVVGQPVTFTATVTSADGAIPNGETVTFYADPKEIGTGATHGGVATFTTSSLAAKTYTIKATYAGDGTFKESSGTTIQVVDGDATTATLASSLNPSIYGQTVTWTATVTTSGSIPPTGKVNFEWDGDSIGTATLNASGVTTLTKSNLNADPYPLTAVYAGDANNGPSTSAILNQVVKETTSAATLSSSANPSTQGQAITFTAKITSPTVTATGPVTFTAGKTVLGTAQLSGGKAKFTTSTLAVGTTTVKATYYGDSNIAESSASVTQTVNP